MNNLQEKQNICPVCNYDGLFDPPYDENGYGSYEICPCCGFQFGLDDYPDNNRDRFEKTKDEKDLSPAKRWFAGSACAIIVTLASTVVIVIHQVHVLLDF